MVAIRIVVVVLCVIASAYRIFKNDWNAAATWAVGAILAWGWH